MGLVNEIYGSRNNIIDGIVKTLQDHLELDGVNLRKSTYLSYLINTLATLTANIMFSSSMAYRENFLTTAQLAESIYNFSEYIGYVSNLANHANVNALIKVNLDTVKENDLDTSGISFNFTIPQYHNFEAGDIPFINEDEYDITINTKQDIQVIQKKETSSIYLPTYVENNILYFYISLNQYKTSEIEYVVPDNLKIYQFWSIVSNFTDQLSEVSVKIKKPNEYNFTYWTYYDNLYSIPPNTNGYTYRLITENMVEIYFGNGNFGKQPDGNSSIIVELKTTKGSSGNIINNSLTTISPISTLLFGKVQNVSLSVINLSPGYGGSNQETLQETKYNAIVNLKQQGRLISEEDWQNIHVIAPQMNLKDNIVILKRSDLKANEYHLYSVLTYENDIIKTSSEKIITDIDTQYFLPYHTFDIDGIQYYNPFMIEIDERDLLVTYKYLTKNISATPSVEYFDRVNYDHTIYLVKITEDDNYEKYVFSLSFNNDNIEDINKVTCKIQLNFKYYSNIPETMELYPVLGIENSYYFEKTIPIYKIRSGECVVNFKIFHRDPTDTYDIKISESYVDVIISQDLRDINRSHYKIIGNNREIYDVPLIEKNWFDNININNQENFELNIIQNFLKSADLTSSRMKNVFLNFKFAKTIGTSKNYFYNNPNYTVKSRNVYDPSTIIPILNERYLLPDYNCLGLWEGKESYIAEWLGDSWYFIDPITNDIVYVEDEEVYVTHTSLKKWIIPIINIPIYIKVTIFSNIRNEETINELVKDKIISIFEGEDSISGFRGLEQSILRDKIYSEIRSLEFVEYCEVNEPQINIKYDFELQDLTKQELLEYTPEYIYITRENIKVINKYVGV